MESIHSPGGAGLPSAEGMGDVRRPRAHALPPRRETPERAEAAPVGPAFRESQQQFLALYEEVKQFLEETREQVPPQSFLGETLRVQWASTAALDTVIGKLDAKAREWYALRLLMPWKRKDYGVAQNAIRQLMAYRKRARVIEERQAALLGG